MFRASLVRRETLCLFCATYSFMEMAASAVNRLWPAVVRELIWVSSLLPLMFADLKRPWCTWLYATDAEGVSERSFGGYGVVRRRVAVETVRQLGQSSERWRFDTDYLAARSQALRQAEEQCFTDLVLGAGPSASSSTSPVCREAPGCQADRADGRRRPPGVRPCRRALLARGSELGEPLRLLDPSS